MIGLLLAGLLSLTAQAQQGQVSIDRFGGLNDVDSPATIESHEAQDALNVESNLEGTAILKRRGFTREASLTVATSPVNGSFTMTCDNGDQLAIVCHDHYCAKSVNGGAFANFISTAGGSAIPTRWSFVTIDGDLYGANDLRDPILKYNCSTLFSPAGFPAGSILALSDERMIILDTSANPNRINYSKSGDVATWATGANAVDPFNDDLGAAGDRFTGAICDRGRCYYFKRTSITACLVADQYTTRCSVISNNIGTQDPQSIVSAPDGIYFRSQDRSFWRLSESGVELLSQKIGNYVRNQAAGSQRSNTQTDQVDWEAGSQSPTGSFNTTTRFGSILNSSTTFVDTSSTNFAAGTITDLSVTDTIGSVTLSSNTAQDNFSDGNYTSNLVWTVTAGAWDITSGYLRSINDTTDNNIQTPISITSGSFRFDWAMGINSPGSAAGCPGGSNEQCFDFRYIKNAGNSFYSVRMLAPTSGSVTPVRMIKNVGGSETVLTSFQYSNPGAATFEIQVSTDGKHFLYIDSVFKSSFTDVAITSSTKLEIMANGDGSPTFKNWFDNIYVYQYRTRGTFKSRIIDTGYADPVFGTFSSTFTTVQNVEGQIIFDVRASTSPNNDMWDAVIVTSDTLRPTNTQKRYVQYNSTFTTFISTKSPSLDDVSIVFATTGTFRTQCIQPGTGVSAWGIMSCAESNLGAGSNVYFTTSAVSCAALPPTLPTAWTATTNNATMTIGTNAAIYIGWRDLLGSATDQAQVDACTVYWNEGTVAQPVWGAYDSIRNSIYWTGTTSTSATSDRLLKYDLNLRQFYPFGISATALSIVNNSLYFGSSAGGYWNKYGAAGINSDNGSSINAYWKSKDFGGASPFQENAYQKLSIVARNQTTGSMTATHSLSNGISGAHTVSLSTTSTKSYVRDNYNLPLASPANFINIQLGNNSAVPFEVLGLKIDLFTQPWKVQSP